jgi:hypothetical protein
MLKTSIGCPICNNPKKHSEQFDANFCERCNVWLEPVCGNRNCEFCSSRPKNPVKNIYTDIIQGIQNKQEISQGVIVRKAPLKGSSKKNEKSNG